MKKKYHIYELNINILNVLSIILLFLTCLITYFINKDLLFKSFIFDNIVIFLILFLAYTILHEILHSIGYVLNGAHYKNITYGMALEKGVLYCLCKENINKKNILISLMYPLFFIGIVTYVIALIFKLPLLLILSICNIAGAIGDIIMFIFIVKLNKDIEYTEFDDPTSFAIYTNDSILEKKHFGLKYIGSKDNVIRKDLKKIKISKQSIIILLITLILCVLLTII